MHTIPPTLVTRKDLLARGYEPYEINARIRKGELLRVARGSFVDPQQIAGTYPEVLFRLKSRAHGENSPHLILSHHSALAIHGVDLYDVNWNRVHLTRSSTNGARAESHRVVHASVMDDRDITVVDGLRVTTVARSLIDYARIATFESAVVAIDSALHRNLVTAEELAAEIVRVRSRKGSPAARRAVLFADHRSESVGESRTRVMLNTMGLATPLSQVEIFDERGKKVGRVDLAYPDLAVLIEFDGHIKYQAGMAPGGSPSEAVIAERYRERELTNLGYEVVRLTWSDLRDPAKVRAEILRAIALAKRRLGADKARGRWKQAV